LASQIRYTRRSARERSAIVFFVLKLLKRWLGWDTDAGLFDLADFSLRPRATPPAQKPPIVVPNRVPEKAAAAPRRAKSERAPLDVLDNPRLSLDKPGDDGFDPYNTGAFNRSASWEKIGRQRKR
jgi:hypothetical protein